MILFVNPPGIQKGVYGELSQTLTAIEPPLWPRLLASYLVRKGISAEILDADAFGLDNERSVDETVALNPRLVVVVAHGQQPSASTQVMPAVTAFCQRFKAEREDVPVLVVGGHPAALPERTLTETGADAVCSGEGPTTVAALYAALRSDAPSWDDVPGLCYFGRTGGTVIRRTQPAENVWGLDREMPGGMWGKLPMSKYRAHNWHALTNGGARQPYASVYTSLGCPFSCGFCVIQAPFRGGDFLRYGGKANSYRMWSPGRVVDDIQALVERYGVRNVKIADEMFVLNRAHVLGVCGEIIERGLGDALNMWAYARVDTCKPELLDPMRRAGVKWLCVGVEAESADVRHGVNKGGYGADDIIDTCKRVRRAGINLLGNFMVGLPSDTRESMGRTLDLALEIMPEFMNVYATVAYPGTPLWESTPEEERSYDWREYAHHSYLFRPAGTKALSRAEVVAFRDEFFRRYYSNDAYQSLVLTKFGPEAVVGIQEMLRIRLKRKLLGD